MLFENNYSYDNLDSLNYPNRFITWKQSKQNMHCTFIPNAIYLIRIGDERSSIHNERSIKASPREKIYVRSTIKIESFRVTWNEYRTD